MNSLIGSLWIIGHAELPLVKHREEIAKMYFLQRHEKNVITLPIKIMSRIIWLMAYNLPKRNINLRSSANFLESSSFVCDSVILRRLLQV